jgi:hypothetical protein
MVVDPGPRIVALGVLAVLASCGGDETKPHTPRHTDAWSKPSTTP